MSLMISELYDALMAAGCPEDKARRAAVVMAGIQQRGDLKAQIRREAWLLSIKLSLAAAAAFGAGMLLTWLAWVGWGGHPL